ncbi:MAG: hypothetical protein JKY50_00215 [Oleispira sp.]|nr:hypothetical protein [Oleispira sp.]
MKIDTLVHDIGEVLQGKHGWDWVATGQTMGDKVDTIAMDRFSEPPKPRKYLSMSSIGQACKRKLWLRVNGTEKGEDLTPDTLLKFFYGDVIEEIVLALAIQSGHEVTGQQDEMSILGVKGHRDAVIDGMTIDVKSASDYAFKKFKEHQLKGYYKYNTKTKTDEWVHASEVDAFGYISQLSSYVYAAKDDPLVTNKTHGAFLVMNKVTGEICLDIYDFTEELKVKEAEVEEAKRLIDLSVPSPVLDSEPMGMSGNERLCMHCRYCEHKFFCHPTTRTFKSARGPVYLSKVVKEPRMEEIT